MSARVELHQGRSQPAAWLLLVVGALVAAVLGMHAVDHHAVAHHGASGAVSTSSAAVERSPIPAALSTADAAVAALHDGAGVDGATAIACFAVLLSGVLIALSRRPCARPAWAHAELWRTAPAQRRLQRGMLRPPDLVALGISRT